MTTTRLSRAGQGWQATVYDNGKYRQSRYFADLKSGGSRAAWRKARAALGGLVGGRQAGSSAKGSANGKPPLAIVTRVFDTFRPELPVRPMAWGEGSGQAGPYRIEHGIPIPGPKYPFADMQVGDSFAAKTAERHRITVAAGAYGKKTSAAFRVCAVSGGIRIWRIK